MYRNIGRKIQMAAKVLFIIGAVISGVLGVIAMVFTKARTGLSLLLGGPFIAWISTWLMYGFGVIVEVHEKQRDLMRQNAPAAPVREETRQNPDPPFGAPEETDAPFTEEDGGEEPKPQEKTRKLEIRDPKWTQEAGGFGVCPVCKRSTSIGYLEEMGLCPGCGFDYVPKEAKEQKEHKKSKKSKK
ncbi:MAG: hypothetical protein IKP10_04925 [Clostridia bacterium]|nr:hypothetical protein [Clostridia bacterium]